MKRLETQKGITLVALIITIVVLLILAVVSIGAVQKSDIIGQAQDAAAKHQEGKDIEGNAITDMESKLDKVELEQSIPKYTEQEKKDLLDLLIEYGNAKYPPGSSSVPNEEEVNRIKQLLLQEGIDPDQAITINNTYYFNDKKVILIEEEANAMFTGNYIFREVTVDELVAFGELYKIAKVVDEKLDKGDYTTNGYDYYFDYNGETLEFVCMAGQYEYRYNEEYYLNVWNLPTGRCLGL